MFYNGLVWRRFFPIRINSDSHIFSIGIWIKLSGVNLSSQLFWDWNIDMFLLLHCLNIFHSSGISIILSAYLIYKTGFYRLALVEYECIQLSSVIEQDTLVLIVESLGKDLKPLVPWLLAYKQLASLIDKV